MFITNLNYCEEQKDKHHKELLQGVFVHLNHLRSLHNDVGDYHPLGTRRYDPRAGRYDLWLFDGLGLWVDP